MKWLSVGRLGAVMFQLEFTVSASAFRNGVCYGVNTVRNFYYNYYFILISVLSIFTKHEFKLKMFVVVCWSNVKSCILNVRNTLLLLTSLWQSFGYQTCSKMVSELYKEFFRLKVDLYDGNLDIYLYLYVHSACVFVFISTVIFRINMTINTFKKVFRANR